MKKLSPSPLSWSWTVKVTWTVPGWDRPGSSVVKVTATTMAGAKSAARFLVGAPSTAKAVATKNFIVK